MERSNWILYPEAKRKLNESGLMRRIETAVKNYKLNYLGFVSEREVVESIRGMNNGRLLESIHVEERNKFKKTLQDAWANRSNMSWLIRRNGEDYKEKMEEEDFLLLSGFRSIGLLRKAELFDYKKFGFSNIFEFTGTTGAAIEMVLGNGIEGDGLKWETTRADGRVITSVITGDNNADLRIYQKDITAYETIDPLGNKVSYRPEMDADRMTVAAYHSTEGFALVAFLKYINQLGLKPKTLENNAAGTINWAKSLGQGGGTCAEHFGGFDKSSIRFFSGWSMPISQLDEKHKTKEACPYNLWTQLGREYTFYIEPHRALVIAPNHETTKDTVDIGKAVSFLPEDVDDAIKGLFYQAARGLGRTSVRQLIDIVEYRFSPDFDKDQAKFSIRS
jgi:hypothetical protein